jgi:ribonuclease P protein 1
LKKQEFYAAEDEIKRQRQIQIKEENAKKFKDLKSGGDSNRVLTNYPGQNSFLRRVSESYQKQHYRNRVCSAFINKNPSIVLDFRYSDMHTRREYISSMVKQIDELIGFNREQSHSPFNMHFCNYKYDSKFHQLYGKMLSLDANMIFETEKSYVDIFPRNDLIYLSPNAKYEMQEYDPSKVYIIGSIVDSAQTATFKYSSVNQAKIDEIRSERLPIDRYMK